MPFERSEHIATRFRSISLIAKQVGRSSATLASTRQLDISQNPPPDPPFSRR